MMLDAREALLMNAPQNIRSMWIREGTLPAIYFGQGNFSEGLAGPVLEEILKVQGLTAPMLGRLRGLVQTPEMVRRLYFSTEDADVREAVARLGDAPYDVLFSDAEAHRGHPDVCHRPLFKRVSYRLIADSDPWIREVVDANPSLGTDYWRNTMKDGVLAEIREALKLIDDQTGVVAALAQLPAGGVLKGAEQEERVKVLRTLFDRIDEYCDCDVMFQSSKKPMVHEECGPVCDRIRRPLKALADHLYNPDRLHGDLLTAASSHPFLQKVVQEEMRDCVDRTIPATQHVDDERIQQVMEMLGSAPQPALDNLEDLLTGETSGDALASALRAVALEELNRGNDKRFIAAVAHALARLSTEYDELAPAYTFDLQTHWWMSSRVAGRIVEEHRHEVLWEGLNALAPKIAVAIPRGIADAKLPLAEESGLKRTIWRSASADDLQEQLKAGLLESGLDFLVDGDSVHPDARDGVWVDAMRFHTARISRAFREGSNCVTLLRALPLEAAKSIAEEVAYATIKRDDQLLELLDLGILDSVTELLRGNVSVLAKYLIGEFGTAADQWSVAADLLDDGWQADSLRELVESVRAACK